MIVSKYDKSYDTADGSEQSDRKPDTRGAREARAEERDTRQRWEDDGGGRAGAGGGGERPGGSAAADLVFAGELTSKPGWSVLSLRDLNEAIRQARDPARLRAEQSRQLDRRHEREARDRDEKAASATRAERDRYRNAWEHA